MRLVVLGIIYIDLLVAPPHSTRVNKELNFTTAAEKETATADAAFYFIPLGRTSIAAASSFFLRLWRKFVRRPPRGCSKVALERHFLVTWK